MSDNNDSTRAVRRRDLLKTTGGVAGFGAFAGCLGGDDDGNDDGGGDDGSDDADSGDDGDGGNGDGGDGGGDTGGTFTIGLANSVTGSLSTFGERNDRGKQLALEDINDVGLRGGELEIQEADTESTASSGVSAAQRLINQEGVPLLIGAVSSGVSVAIYESVVQDTDVDQISQNSTSPDLTNFPELLRMSPPGRSQATAIADLVAQDDHDSVAVAYVNNAYGNGVASVFEESFEGEIVYSKSHSQGESSYANVVTAMNDSGADAWVFITYQPEFTTMAQESFDRGYAPPVYGADSITGPDVLDQAPAEFLEDSKAVVPSAAISTDYYQDFASRFEEEFDTQPTSWATYCYDAIVTAALAIEAADEVSTSAITNESIKEITRPSDGSEEVNSYEAGHEILANGGTPGDLNYSGISGPIDLDENGDPAAFLEVVQVRDGAYESIDTISGGGGS